MFNSSPYRPVFGARSLESPLTTYLWSRADVSTVVRRLGNRVLDEPRDDLVASVVHDIRQWLDPPRLGEQRDTGWQDHPDPNFRFARDPSKPSHPRLRVLWKVDGDVDMLVWFPDAAVARGIPPLAGPPPAGVDGGYHQDAYWMLPSRFTGGPWDDQPFVFTEVTVTPQEWDQIERLSLDARPTELRRHHFIDRLAALVDSIGPTIDQWIPEVRTAAERNIEHHRRRLRRISIANEGLAPDARWRPSRPALTRPDPAATTGMGDSSRAATELSRERLSPTTFTELLAVTRKWAEALHRANRSSFASMHEEHLSALLAATLNALFPFAGQEVFSYHGKTDIYVRADRLDGTSPEKVFIMETHWWDGDTKLHRKLDQLIGYLAVRDTDAVLISAIKDRKDVPDVDVAMRTHPTEPTRIEPVAGFNTYALSIGSRRVRVSSVVLDLRTAQERSPEPGSVT